MEIDHWNMNEGTYSSHTASKKEFVLETERQLNRPEDNIFGGEEEKKKKKHRKRTKKSKDGDSKVDSQKKQTRGGSGTDETPDRPRVPLKLLTLGDFQDMKELITSQVPPGKVLYCSVKRNRTWCNRFSPQYDVYMSEGFKYMMSGKKRTRCTSSSYAISANNQEVMPESPDYLGKLRSNFVGSLFNLYDTGYSCREAVEPTEVRVNLATVEYETNIFGSGGPRKMRVYLPRPEALANCRQNDPEWDLREEFDKQNGDVQQIVSKAPKWNEQLRTYVLNFNGRVDKPSVKNFLLVDERRDDEVLLLFGRVGEDLFNMDVHYPFSPLQAFGVVLSSLDNKIAVQ